MAIRLGVVQGNFWTKGDKLMMAVIFKVLFVILLVKLLWNIFTPCVVAYRFFVRKARGGGGSSAISLVPMVEVGLLVVMVGVAKLFPFAALGLSATEVAIFGAIAVVFSYALMALIGVIVRGIAASSRK